MREAKDLIDELIALGYSQREISILAETSQATISKLVLNKAKAVRFGTYTRLAKAVETARGKSRTGHDAPIVTKAGVNMLRRMIREELQAAGLLPSTARP